MDTLLREEKLVIECLSKYGCLKWEQLEKLLSYKKPELVERILIGLKKRQLILEDESGYVTIDPRASRNQDVIMAFWVFLHFIDKIDPNNHYPANYPAQIYFLKGTQEYEIMSISENDTHLIKALFSENRNNSNDEEDVTKYIFIVPSKDIIQICKKNNAIPASSIENKQILFAVVKYPDPNSNIPDFDFLRYE